MAVGSKWYFTLKVIYMKETIFIILFVQIKKTVIKFLFYHFVISLMLNQINSLKLNQLCSFVRNAFDDKKFGYSIIFQFFLCLFLQSSLENIQNLWHIFLMNDFKKFYQFTGSIWFCDLFARLFENTRFCW